MTVYVRLVNGMEDQHPPYKGCKNCAYPLDGGAYPLAHWRSPGKGGKDYGCPGCGAFDRWNESNEYTITSLQWWNPSVDQGLDGSLTIRRKDTQVAFYPVGAWMSWRSD
jgi:hypothetical protein